MTPFDFFACSINRLRMLKFPFLLQSFSISSSHLIHFGKNQIVYSLTFSTDLLINLNDNPYVQLNDKDYTCQFPLEYPQVIASLSHQNLQTNHEQHVKIHQKGGVH